MVDRAARGRDAEARARAHLEAHGLVTLATNWKIAPRPGAGGHGGELDLVMREGDVLVIVEVRSGHAGFAGGAAYTVGPLKQRRLAGLAQRFLMTLTQRPRAVRFDVVTLDLRDGAATLKWIRSAFTV